MNLQENYKRLFKSKARSNDGSILLEARYNIKVADHRISSAPGVEGFRVIYNGTIAGPDIPNGTKFEAIGVAGDIAIPYSKFRADLTLSSKLEFPNATTAMLIYHANDDLGENEEDEGSQAERYYNGAKWPLAFMPKAKKDEVSKMIDDAVVKYALSKGLEDHVAKKDGGTFDVDAAKNLKKRKRKPALDKDALADVVMKIADDAGGGRDMTDDIIDELGDFYDAVQKSRNKKLIDAYDDLRSTSDGEPNDQAEAAEALLNLLENYKGMNKMNLRENYKRLFKGKARSNDRSLINEAVAEPNSILVKSINNSFTFQDFPSPEPLDDQIYADAVEMAEDKYANGAKMDFIYMDVDGKAHEGEITIKGVSDYEGPYWENESKFKSETQMTDENIIDMFDEFS
jgi:hypothetical protein